MCVPVPMIKFWRIELQLPNGNSTQEHMNNVYTSSCRRYASKRQILGCRCIHAAPLIYWYTVFHGWEGHFNLYIIINCEISITVATPWRNNSLFRVFIFTQFFSSPSSSILIFLFISYVLYIKHNEKTLGCAPDLERYWYACSCSVS